MGDTINTLIKTVDEMGEWDTLNDINGNPLYDIQLDFDDSIDKESEDTKYNHENYNLQYVNLVEDNFSLGSLKQGDNWDNIELVVISTVPFLKTLGIKHKNN